MPAVHSQQVCPGGIDPRESAIGRQREIAHRGGLVQIGVAPECLVQFVSRSQQFLVLDFQFHLVDLEFMEQS